MMTCNASGKKKNKRGGKRRQTIMAGKPQPKNRTLTKSIEAGVYHTRQITRCRLCKFRSKEHMMLEKYLGLKEEWGGMW